MSTPYSAWSFEGTDPGTSVTLDQPLLSRWKILEKLNEHDYQVNVEENEEYGFISFASAKFICCDPKRRSKKAFMRIYKQVPHRKTKMWDADARGRQATTYTPREMTAYLDLTQKGSINTPKLIAYKTGTQDRSRLVPGGFIIWLVWGIVPGLRLRDGYGADTFWALESGEREQVRLAFVKSLPKLVGNGWYPVSTAESLVWHRETQTLFVVGESHESKPQFEVDVQRIAAFELAKPDPSYRRGRKGWDKDTSRWQW